MITALTAAMNVIVALLLAGMVAIVVTLFVVPSVSAFVPVVLSMIALALVAMAVEDYRSRLLIAEIRAGRRTR